MANTDNTEPLNDQSCVCVPRTMAMLCGQRCCKRIAASDWLEFSLLISVPTSECKQVSLHLIATTIDTINSKSQTYLL